MAVKTRGYHPIYEHRRLSFHRDARIGGYHPDEWVWERGLDSRNFESNQVTPALVTESQQGAATFFRSGQGSLRGKLILTDDWDSDEVNDEIAREFGLEP
jgi:hypothetical protein